MSRSHAAQSTMRSAVLALAALALLSLPMHSQTAESDPTTQPDTGSANPRGRETQHHDAGSVEASAPAMRDKLFLRGATVGGLAEIQLSKLALQQSNADDIKQFAGEIIADHTKINNDLKSIAESQGVMLPTRLATHDQGVYDRLKGLSSEDFDREYIKTLAEDHHKDLRDFRSEVAFTQDESLRSTVQDATKMIHHHMVKADQLARAKGVPNSQPARVAGHIHVTVMAPIHRKVEG